MTDEAISADRAIDVALAEFNTLRAEIGGAQTTSNAAIGVGLTAAGILSTYALQANGDRLLLAGVPFVTLIISLVYLNEISRIFRIGDYIHSELWPFLASQTGYPSSWERHAHSHARDWKLTSVLLHIALDGGVPVLLGALGAAALAYSPATGPLAVCGWLATVATLAFPLAFAGNRRKIAMQRRAREEAAERRTEPAAG